MHNRLVILFPLLTNIKLPRTLHALSGFRTSLPSNIAHLLSSSPSRSLTASAVEATKTAGRTLWTSIHRPLDILLGSKLGTAHPDLPGFAMDYLYGGLFSDVDTITGVKLGRLNMSLFAIACLRAQQGTEAQLVGHLLGLKKAWDTWDKCPYTESEEAVNWLKSDQGCFWTLRTVDDLAIALGQGRRPKIALTPKL